MPTDSEFQELCDPEYTEFVDASGNVISGQDKRTTYNGVVGLLIRSKANGNTLFLPAAGYYNGTVLVGGTTVGSYWSSSFFSNTNAYRLYFNQSGLSPQSTGDGRRYGFTVRAVKDAT